MNNCYYIFGLKRSGNHAIINWLKSMMESPLHLNDIGPNMGDHTSFYGPGNKSNPRWNPDDGGIEEYKDFIISYEDVPEHQVNWMTEMNAVFRLHSKGYRKILIQRSIKNWIASLYAMQVRDKYPHWSLERGVALWRSYDASGKFDISIKYDTWNRDKKYRVAIAKELGLKYGESTLSEMTTEGGGSSFGDWNFNSRWDSLDKTTKEKLCKYLKT